MTPESKSQCANSASLLRCCYNDYRLFMMSSKRVYLAWELPDDWIWRCPERWQVSKHAVTNRHVGIQAIGGSYYDTVDTVEQRHRSARRITRVESPDASQQPARRDARACTIPRRSRILETLIPIPSGSDSREVTMRHFSLASHQSLVHHGAMRDVHESTAGERMTT